MNYQKSGLFLQARRKEMNLTQRELADKIGVSDKTISKWECGKGLPDLEILSELCKTLGITVNDYVSGEMILTESYSSAAEENMMELLKENESNGRKGLHIQILCGTAAALMGIFLLLVTNFGLTWKSAAWYFDPMTLGTLLVCLAACLLLSGTIRRGKQQALAFCQGAILPLGSLLSLFQIMNGLNTALDAPAAYISVSVGGLPLLYALGIDLVLVLFQSKTNQ